MSNILTKDISMPRLRRPELRRPEKGSRSGRPTLGGPTLSLPGLSRQKSGGGVTVGLEIEAGSVAAAEAKVDGTARIVAAGIQPMTPEAFRDGEVAEPDAVAHALRTLFERHDLNRRVRLGIANQRLVVRTLRLPAIDDPDDLDSAVRFSAQEQIAMPLDDAVIEHRIVGGVAATEDTPAQVDVMIVAARREMILATLKPLRDAGLEAVAVDLSAFGMLRALAPEGPAATPGAEGDAVLYCHVGDATNLAVARGRTCLFTRVSSAGLEDISTGLTSSTGLSHEHAGLWLSHVGLGRPIEEIEGDPDTIARTRDALDLGADSLVDELRLSLDFYAAQEAAIPVERIVLCGPGGAIPGLAERMEPAVGLPISVGLPHALSGYDAATAARLTLPLGLALEA
jgi:type IV pilus assembly protein PilM